MIKIVLGSSFILISMILVSLLISSLTSCTYNVSLVHTEGTATDVGDDNPTSTPETYFPQMQSPKEIEWKG